MNHDHESRARNLPRCAAATAPENEFLVRALRAIEGGRLRDACTNIAAIPNVGELAAWREFLKARVEIMERNLGAAEERLQAAQSLLAETKTESRRERAFEAMILEHQGMVYRRQERLDEAREAHKAAYQLRAAAASADEQFESAHSAALTALLQGDGGSGEEWLRIAGDIAAQCQVPAHSKAATLSAQAALERHRGDLEAAVDCSRSALSLLIEACPGSAQIHRTQLDLAGMLVERSESAQREPSLAQSDIAEAVRLMEDALAEFEAIGPHAVEEARWCEDLLDHARRLQRSLDEG